MRRLILKLLPMTTAVILCLLVVPVVQASRPTVARGTTRYYQVKRAVCHYFTGYLCGEAMVVVGCETGHTYSVWASNGQYRGLFQMGSHERATYGDSNNAWGQARAAHNYYMRSGWRPWQCTPYGGLRW